MPTAFDTAQYTANWDPTKSGTFVSPQDVMAANGNMWSEVWNVVVSMIPTFPQIETLFENNLEALFTSGTTTTTGTSYPILTWLDSLTGLNLVGLAESLTGLDTTGSSTLLGQLIGAAGGSGATLADWTAVFDAFLSGDSGVEISAWDALVTALFGTTTLGTFLQISAIPTGIPQANISGLEADLVGLLSSSTFDASWNALMTLLFGTTSLGTALQISALPTNIPQSSVSGLGSSLASYFSISAWDTWLSGAWTTWLSWFGQTPSTVGSAPVIAQSHITGLTTALATFLTTGNYNTLLTALFGTTTVGSTVQVAAVPTGIPQSYISGLGTALATFLTTGNYNTLLTALFGSTTITPTINVNAVPTGIPQSYITGLGTALATFLTTGNWNTLLTALFGTTTVGSAIQTTALPASIPQSYISGLSTALTTFLTTGNYNTLLTALFGTTTVGSTIAVAAVPTGIPATKVANVLGGANLGADVAAINSTANAAVPAGGAPGTLAAWLNALFGSTTGGTILQSGAIPPIQASNVVPGPNPSSTAAITHGASGTGWTPNITSGNTLTVNGSHTALVTDNCVAVPIIYAASGALAAINRSAFYGTGSSTTPMTSMGAVPFPTAAGDVWLEWFVLLGDIPSGPQTVAVEVSSINQIYYVAADSQSYGGVGTVANLLWENTGSNGNPSLSVSSAAGDMALTAFGVVYGGGSPTLASYSPTQRYNSGSFIGGSGEAVAFAVGEGPGAASVAFSAVASIHNALEYWAAAGINLIATPAVIGSGFRAYCTSTAAIASSTGVNLLPNNTFPNTSYMTSDYAYSATGNTLTVENAGWYKVTIKLLTDSYTTFLLGPVLYHKGAVAEYGMMQYVQKDSMVISDTFLIYCNAGDTLQPGYYAGTAYSATFTGESTGTQCFWSASLMNRSLL
jgi:hypothetical protein